MSRSDDFTWQFRLLRVVAQAVFCVVALCLFWMILPVASYVFTENSLYFLIFFGSAAVIVLGWYFVWFVFCLFRGKWDDDYLIPAKERIVLFSRCAGIATGYVFGCAGGRMWYLLTGDERGAAYCLMAYPVHPLLMGVAWAVLVWVAMYLSRGAAEKRCR